jgi:prevent-host-death family protein
MQATSVTETAKGMPKVSTTDLARQIGRFIDESLRREGVIVQRYGRNVAVLMDYQKWAQLMSLASSETVYQLPLEI